MILLDTETTGLLGPSSTPLKEQPYIIEVGAVKVDDETLKPRGKKQSLSFLIKPPVLPLPEKITQITGITDKDLVKQKPFAAFYPQLCDFFLGESILVAHNAPFDAGMLSVELSRMGKRIHFPWPSQHWCTAERTAYLNTAQGGKYFKLEGLYRFLFNKDPKQTHRALEDVELLLQCVRALRKKKVL